MSRTNHHYTWTIGGTPPPIEDHSLAKHEVLESYLLRYVEVLTRNIRREGLKLTLVDGFAGGGLYTGNSGELHLGSPLRMIRAMEVAEAKAQLRRKKPFVLDVEFIFLEKDKEVLDFLKSAVRRDPSASRYLKDGRVFFVHGTFDSKISRIAEHVEKRGQDPRAIFLLDQYGYTDVPLHHINGILGRFSNAEIMLTFATDWLLDYLSDKNHTRAHLSAMGLGHLAGSFEELIAQKERKSNEWRRAAQALLHRDLVDGSGAKFFTPFFIRSPRAHRDYWFVHLSGHSRARDEMASLHWNKKNSFSHYGKAGLSMLGYDPEEDPLVTGQPSFEFGDGDRERSKRALIEELPRRLESLGGEIPYDRFFMDICNDTPLNEVGLQDVLKRLQCERIVRILNKHERPRRVGVHIQNDDIIMLSKQQYWSWSE